MSENMICDNTRSLIAVGASIAANCQPCLKHHVAKALELNIDKNKIAEAIEVGKAVSSGAAGSMDKLVAEMKRTDLNLCASTGEAQCCCGQ